MIPQAFIIEWSNYVPWQTYEQVEQDLVISRALVEIFSDEWLSSHLAFRGGTALHKLYLQPQPRYSEDIDLVQIHSEPIKETITRLQKCLTFLGEGSLDQKANNNTLKYRFDSEFPPVQKLKLKVEINCREHFSVLGYHHFPFEVKSSWFTGSCNITTYQPEELIGTKIRALYQRKKGRDLYDLYKALIGLPALDKMAIMKCYREYIQYVVEHPPSQKIYLQNMEAKMKDPEFLGDITGLIRPAEQYNMLEAYQLVKTELLEKLDETKTND